MILLRVRNDLDRSPRVPDVADRLSRLGANDANCKQTVEDQLIEHEPYSDGHGQDLRAVRAWTWGASQ